MNKLYDEIQIGDEATIERVCTANDLIVFAHATGNINTLHLPKANDKTESETVAPSMWVGSLFSAILGNVLPGQGTLYKSQTLHFHQRAHLGDQLRATVKVIAKQPERAITLDCKLINQKQELLAEGIAEVTAPERKIEAVPGELPDLMIKSHQHFDRLLVMAKELPPLVTAVVCPEDNYSLGGTLLAHAEGLIKPILIGSKARIQATAEAIGTSIADLELLDIKEPGMAASRAIALVHEGKAQAVMKGHIHSDELLSHCTKAEGGLRTARRISHTFVMDVPGLDHLLLITDAAINILPSLDVKVDIVQNAIDLALAIGINKPRVGILSAVETVNPKIPSTLDAAILAKMAERGQIKGGIVDGPLAMDNAIDIDAAKTKGITSLVAGRADILVVPNLEAGNMLAKELAFIAEANGAGLVLGAKVPVILTSRAENEQSRLASCALAQLYQHWRQTDDYSLRPSTH